MSTNNSNNTSSELSKAAYLLITLIAITVILVYSEEYIVPFIVALLVWFIIHELREKLQLIPFVKDRFPIWLQSTIAFLIINLVIFLVADLIYINMSQLSESMALYERNITPIMNEVNQLVGMNISSKVSAYTSGLDFTTMISSLIDTTTTLFGNGFLILIYVAFLLVEERIFPLKLKAFYPDANKQNKMVKLFEKMDKKIGQYLRLKTLVSSITGLLSYFVLLAFGIDAALFWALLIFVLNFIPTIGSLIATIFPAIFAVLQFGELAPFVYIMLSVGAIQVVVGNIIEPKLMGDSLNISSLVVVLSLTIWGAIWGIMGMILSVPITVMMIIVFEEIPSLKFIAIALSEKGEHNADIESKKV